MIGSTPIFLFILNSLRYVIRTSGVVSLSSARLLEVSTPFVPYVLLLVLMAITCSMLFLYR
jgi:hypothetical protein